MHILIATDAWAPQVNGVVNSLKAMTSAAQHQGARFTFITPQHFHTLPMPTYPDIRLSLVTSRPIGVMIEKSGAEHIHIATEGPIGLAARAHCQKVKRPFTTSYHTRFPEYVAARAPIPLSWTYPLMRRFHNSGIGTMVSTPSVEADLARRGFVNLMRWSRGVDHTLFNPSRRVDFGFKGPVFLDVGRVAVEKNIEAFLELDLPGSKVVVGDGPARKALEHKYPDAHFLGMKSGVALAQAYASADVFVFPSRTDTFGIVLLEALASGLPVAAYPVTGPLDVIGGTQAGCLDENLHHACMEALRIPREAALALAKTYSWDNSARQFLQNVENAHRTSRFSTMSYGSAA